MTICFLVVNYWNFREKKLVFSTFRPTGGEGFCMYEVCDFSLDKIVF